MRSDGRIFSEALNFTRPPNIEPVIKLVPIIKLIGSLIVSLINKLTLTLVELFWIPINSIKKRLEL